MRCFEFRYREDVFNVNEWVEEGWDGTCISLRSDIDGKLNLTANSFQFKRFRYIDI